MDRNPNPSQRLQVKLVEMLFILSDEIEAPAVSQDQLRRSIFSINESFLGVSFIRDIEDFSAITSRSLPKSPGLSLLQGGRFQDEGVYFSTKGLQMRPFEVLHEESRFARKVARVMFVKRASMPGVIVIRFSREIIDSIRSNRLWFPRYEGITSYIELECLIRSTQGSSLPAPPMPCEEILNPPQLRVKPVIVATPVAL